MSNTHDNPTRELSRLLLLYLNDACSPGEFERLVGQLKSDPAMLDYYIDFMVLYAGLVQSRECVELQAFQPEPSELCLLDPAFWTQLSREERAAPAIEIRDDLQAAAGPQYRKVARPPRTWPKGYLWFSIVSIAATFLLILYVWTHPRHIPQDIATVTDIYRARWDNPDLLVGKGTRLFDNRKPMKLIEGMLKVQFDDGVQVVIQSPAVFSFESDSQMRLTYGQLYARVPRPAIGFRVDTPSCGVIDLGTEFGVDVTDRGEANVHLFKGKASLVTTTPQQTQQRQILQPQQAKCVTLSGQVKTVTFQDRRFVRDFDSERSVFWNGQSLSLAHIASGGKGWGPVTPDVGINPKTGRLMAGNRELRDQPAVAGYMPVPELAFVDGVFVPDGGPGPVQVTSAGHVYDAFGDTGGDYFMPIGMYSSVNMVHADQPEPVYTDIHLKNYPEGAAVNLCLHANAGITFDLQAIRDAMPFVRLKRFTSVYGVPVTRADQQDVAADFYVFIDGRPQMIRRSVSNQDEPEQISLPLSETDRYLTLVCTEGEQNYGDWSLFVNPVLELDMNE